MARKAPGKARREGVSLERAKGAFPDGAPPGQRWARNGAATDDPVFSACADGNDRLFPRIPGLYVKPGGTVSDTACGKGVFRRRVPPGRYDLRAIDTGRDARS